MAEVVLKGVCKRYGNVQAVTGLNLECREGEFLVLLGPSGAGKTSTLKMISGLESVTSGEVYIGGRKVNDLEPRQRGVAMVFENYSLFPHLTVFENLASPLKAARLPAAEVERKVRAAAATLQISSMLDRKPAQLSGGQQQRVSLGRALVKDAGAYLMDEPLSHLDAKLRHEMRSELKRIHSEMPVTTIYVTHDFSEALALADRVLVLDQGVVQQVGTPDEIYEHPVSDLVADMVGEPPMNLIDCAVVAEGSELRFHGLGFSLPVPPHLAPALAGSSPKRRLRMGIRPSQITAGFTAEAGAVPGEVYVLEPLGGVSILTVKVGESLVRIRVKDDFKAELGETVHLSFDSGKLCAFDQETGRSIA